MEYLGRQNGYELKTVKAAIDLNTYQKTMLFKKACRRLITFNGLKVAVLGLTFKPGTDDLREAPSLENVPLLLDQGAYIYAYDPVGAENLIRLGQRISNANIQKGKIAKEAYNTLKT